MPEALGYHIARSVADWLTANFSADIGARCYVRTEDGLYPSGAARVAADRITRPFAIVTVEEFTTERVTIGAGMFRETHTVDIDVFCRPNPGGTGATTGTNEANTLPALIATELQQAEVPINAYGGSSPEQIETWHPTTEEGETIRVTRIVDDVTQEITANARKISTTLSVFREYGADYIKE